MNEEFKKNEGLAKKVMDILIEDYISKFEVIGYVEDNTKYLEIIKWSIEDYETCGYNMKQYRTYLNILTKQIKRKEDRLRGSN